jgi:hypothetical protein
VFFGVWALILTTVFVPYLRVGFFAMATMGYTANALTLMSISFTSGSHFAGLAWLAVAIAIAPAHTSEAALARFLNEEAD